MLPPCTLTLGGIDWVVPARVVQQSRLVDRSSSCYKAANNYVFLKHVPVSWASLDNQSRRFMGGLLIVNAE